jgi:hypothetical protein
MEKHYKLPQRRRYFIMSVFFRLVLAISAFIAAVFLMGKILSGKESESLLDLEKIRINGA